MPRKDLNLIMGVPITTTSQLSICLVVVGKCLTTHPIANKLMMLSREWLTQITWIGRRSRDSSALWMEQVVPTSILIKWQSICKRTKIDGISLTDHQDMTTVREEAIKEIIKMTIGIL